MSKSHVLELLAVVHHIFQDATYNYPTLAGEFVKDEIRLRRLVESRGINALCVDLVRAGKHLDRCLAGGEYKLSGLPATQRVSKRVVIPKFLRGLYLLVFDETGRLKEEPDIEAIIFLRQILFVAKKVELPCPVVNISNEVREFYDVDLSLPEPECFWNESTPTLEDAATFAPEFRRDSLYISRVKERGDASLRRILSTLLRNLDTVSRLLTITLGPYQPNEWRFRHGPGAISERTGPTNKFCWSNWSDRLENVYPIADYGFHNLSSWAARCDQMNISSSEPMSRLIAVPKTVVKPRLIAAEPSEHQWCQQNLWHYFSNRTAHSWISNFIRFRDQSWNQELCVRGSEDGSLATVDLSAASDRVTCHIVGNFFRVNPRLLLSLQSTRTRFMKQALNRNVPGEFPLRKFSTMGSACTFPVQSLLFLGIALACVATQRGWKRVTRKRLKTLKGQVAVFGDDIVIPEDSRGLLFEALEILHFKVNCDKSFWTGRFRESCGVDAFRGVNVTPAFWRAPNSGKPEATASTIEVHNNFYSKFLLCTASYLATTMRGDSIPRVRMASGFLGLKSFQRPIRPAFTRWNKGLQKAEALVTTLNVTIPKLPIEDDSALFQYFTEAPHPSILWKGGVAQRPLIRKKKRWVSIESLDSES